MRKLFRVSGSNDAPIRESRRDKRIVREYARASGGLLMVSGVDAPDRVGMLHEAGKRGVNDLADTMEQIGAPLTAKQKLAMQKAATRSTTKTARTVEDDEAEDDEMEDITGDPALDGILQPDDDVDDDDDDDDEEDDEDDEIGSAYAELVGEKRRKSESGRRHSFRAYD